MVRILSTSLFIALLIASGCGKSDQNDAPRFNETLGEDAVGAPPGPGTVDTGVLKDPATYEPAAYESLEPETFSAGAGDAGSPEAQAAREAMTELIDAVFELDFEMVLEAFVPEQVEALMTDEYLDNLAAMSDAMDASTQAFKAKATTPELEAMADMYDMLAELAEPLQNTIVISVLDEENAIATFDMARLELSEDVQNSFAQMAQTAMAMSSQMQAGMMGGSMPPGAAAAPPNAGSPEAAGGMLPGGLSPEMLQGMLAQVKIPISLRKVDDAWRISLPFTFEEQHAELVNEAVTVVKEMSEETTRALEQVETLDLQTYMQLSQQVQMRHMPALMGLAGRAAPMFSSLMDTTDETQDDAAEGEEEQAESDEAP